MIERVELSSTSVSGQRFHQLSYITMLLTRQDSNLYLKIQSLPCCHYTTSYYCRFNRARTHIPRVVFWSVIQLHHKPICVPPWIRTKTELGLNQRPLPFGLVVLLLPACHLARLLKMSTRHFLNATFCTGRETRTLKNLCLKQARMPIPPFLQVLNFCIPWENRTPIC